MVMPGRFSCFIHWFSIPKRSHDLFLSPVLRCRSRFGDRSRSERDEFIITHEFLSRMLGTRRSSVTLAAGTLQRARLIDYRRWRMHIADRPGLESVARECYSIIKAAWDAFLGGQEQSPLTPDLVRYRTD